MPNRKHKKRSNTMTKSKSSNLNKKKCVYWNSRKTDIINKEGTLVFRWFKHPYKRGKSMCGDCHRKRVNQTTRSAPLWKRLYRRLSEEDTE